MRVLLLVACLSAAPARAEAPRVATDIVPVAALAARVMDGVGAPELLVPPTASPHGHAMRPSEAAALERADLVVRIGPALTPWLEEAIAALAPDAEGLVLLDVPGTVLREAGEDHDHDHGGDHGADGHAGEDHAEEAGHDHDDHAADGDRAGGHGDADRAGAGVDPHAWLDPRNGAAWLSAIAGALAALDPENAATYRANAAAGRIEIEALEAAIDAIVAPADGLGFLTLHDAYGYFEDRTGLVSSGSIRLSDATEAGPARLEALRARLEAEDIACLFSEPQFDDRLAVRLLEGTDVRLVTLDPLGGEERVGPDGYAVLLRTMAEAMAACLTR